MRLDGLQRANADTCVGRARHHPPRRIAARKPRGVRARAARDAPQGPTQALKQVFFRRPMVAGDLVATNGHQPAQNVPPEVSRMFNQRRPMR